MRHILIASLLFLLPSATASATAVIVFRQPSLIVLASDSAVQWRGSKKSVQLKCKIIPSGRWWFSTPGYAGDGVWLDVQQLTGRALTTTRTMAEAKAALLSKVFPPLRDGLKSARSLQGFHELYREGTVVSSIIVAGTDNDVLSVAILVTLLASIEPFALRAVWLSCPGSWCDEAGKVFYGASIDAKGPAVAYLIPPLAPWVKRADSAAALRIIREQIAVSRGLVAPPIEALEITARGAQWHRRDPASLCPPIINPKH